MVTNKDSVQLADYCFNVCWTLKTAIGVESEGDLDESGRIALNDLQKCVDWPSTLDFPANCPQGCLRDRADAQKGSEHATHGI